MADVSLTLNTNEYPLTVVDGTTLTLSLNGAAGPTGPNTITTSTTTALNGYIYGNGTTVAGATAATSAATANTLVLRDAQGGASFTSTSGTGASITSTSGAGASLTSYNGAGASITSTSGAGASITSTSGTYHATFGNSGIDMSFIARVKGSFGWNRSTLTARLHPPDTLTASQVYTLPDLTGTVALTDVAQSWSGTQTFSGLTAFTNAARPTSTASGTPEATSLITQTDGVDLAINPNNIIVRDDFMGGGTATQTIGDLGWFTFSSGGGTGAAIAAPSSILPNIGVKTLTCGNATSAGTVIYLSSLSDLLTYAGWEICFVTKLTQTTDCDLIVGLTKDNAAIGIGKFGGISFGARYSSATDTNFMFYSKNTNLTFAANDANNYAISSGVAAGTTFNTFRIRSIVAGALQMSINGGSFVAVNNSSITTTGAFIPFFYIATRTTTSKSIDVDFFSMKMQSIAR
jgi:hypothetical protein